MSQAAKVLWSEGLTLGPHHFQRQDLYHEARLHRVTTAFSPHLWGVRFAQWNCDALGHNCLTAETLSLILPDGEPYDAPGTDLLPASVDLSTLPSKIQTFTFYAALPLMKSHGGNADPGARYTLSETETSDMFSEAVPIEVPYLQKRLCLLCDTDSRDGYTGFPIVRIQRLTQGGFEVDPTFAPASLTVEAAGQLPFQLGRLISVMTAKMEVLHAAHRGRNGKGAEVHPADIASWWMHNILSMATASLQYHARANMLHPELLYDKLLALAGSLAIFSDSARLPDLPPYIHAAPGPAFDALDALIRELCDSLISVRYFTIPLLQDENRRSHRRGTLDPTKIGPDTQLCIAVSAAMPALELVAAVPTLLKIGSPEDVDRMLATAMPGLPLVHMPQVPGAIPIKPETYYFSLSTNNRLYENALNAKVLVIYAPSGLAELNVELFALAP